MKKYEENVNNYFEDKSNCIYYVAETATIKSIYKSMRKAWGREVTNLCPMFCDFPKFSADKSVYAICVDVEEGYFQIVNSDTIMLMILENTIEEVK